MHRSRLLASCALGLALAAPARAQQADSAVIPDYWPTNGWRTASPESEGLDSRELTRIFALVRERHVPIHSLIIVRDGRILLDATFFPYRAADVHDLASATKSVTATLIGIAIGNGRLSGVRQPLLPLFPGRTVVNRDLRKDRITIGDLLSMSSGLACEWMQGETTLDEMRRAPDWIQYVLDRPMVADPGSTFAYCSPGMHLLSAVISQATGSNALTFAGGALFQPLGIRDAVWPHDAAGVSYGWGDLHLHPRDMAKLGLLWLAGGRWEDRQIVPADWMREAQRQQVAARDRGYGYGFWVYPDRTPPIYEALGRGGQRISIVPAWHMVVVMTGGGFEPGDVGTIIGSAVRSAQPLPENPVAKMALDSAVAAAARPPAPGPVSAEPPIARAIAGRRFTLDRNPLGLTAITLSPGAPGTATVRLEGARAEQFVVGLDSVPRLTASGRFGLPAALAGAWEDEHTFRFDYDEVANINCYTFRLAFEGDHLGVELRERTGLVNVRFEGRAAPRATP